MKMDKVIFCWLTEHLDSKERAEKEIQEKIYLHIIQKESLFNVSSVQVPLLIVQMVQLENTLCMSYERIIQVKFIVHYYLSLDWFTKKMARILVYYQLLIELMMVCVKEQARLLDSETTKVFATMALFFPSENCIHQLSYYTISPF